MDHSINSVTRNADALAGRAPHPLLSGRINAASAQASFRLEGGQILLCAGHRVLHGRTALRSDGRRHLQDAYCEHDNVRNHLRLLRLAGLI